MTETKAIAEQVEGGFVRIGNGFLERLIDTRIPGEYRRVLEAAAPVVRKIGRSACGPTV